MASFLIVGCAEDEFSDIEHVSRANDYYDSGDLAASNIELKNAIQKNPENNEARWLLGKLYVEIGNGPSAEKELKQAIQLGLPRYVVLASLGQAKLLQKKYDEILDEIKVLGNLDSVDKAKVYAIRGEAYSGNNNLVMAEQEFKKAISINPNAILAKIGLAKLSIKNGKPDQARNLLGEAVVFDPGAVNAWILIGELEENEGNLDAAYKAYSTIMERAPWMSKALFKRIEISMESNKIDAARADIRLASRKFKQSPYIEYVLGRMAIYEGDFSGAESHLEKFLTYSPQHLPANYFLGLTYFRQGQIQRALVSLNKVYSSRPNSESTMRLIAQCLARLHDYQGALKLLKPLLLKYQDDEKLWRSVGLIYLRSGDAENGIQYLEKASELGQGGGEKHSINELEIATEPDPGLMQTNVLLILAYINTKQYDKAMKVAEHMRNQYPDNIIPLNLIGTIYLKQGETEKALESFHDVLKIQPENPEAIQNLADHEVNKGNMEEAHSLYERVLGRHPDHLLTMISLAEVEYRQNKVGAAITRLEYAMSKYPKALQPMLLLARYHLNNKKPAQALEILQGIQGDHSDNLVLITLMGETQLAHGQIASAILTFQKLVNLQQESSGAHYLLAMGYKVARDVDKMRSSLVEALKKEPTHVPSKIALSTLFMSEGNIDQANKYLRELKQGNKERHDIFALEGWLAFSQKRYSDAVNAYNKVMKLEPESAVVRMLASAQWQKGDKDGAILSLNNWLKEHPEDVEALIALADSYSRHGEPDKAMGIYSRILKDSPNSVIALNNLALILPDEDSGKAINYARQAVRIMPENAAFLDTLGVLLVKTGQLDTGIIHLNKAAKLAPGNMEIRFNLALAYIRSNDIKQARAILERILHESKADQDKEKARNLLNSL